jgi:hypothetical protein
MESPFVLKESKQKLTAVFESLNPFDLRDANGGKAHKDILNDNHNLIAFGNIFL